MLSEDEEGLDGISKEDKLDKNFFLGTWGGILGLSGSNNERILALGMSNLSGLRSHCLIFIAPDGSYKINYENITVSNITPNFVTHSCYLSALSTAKAAGGEYLDFQGINHWKGGILTKISLDGYGFLTSDLVLSMFIANDTLYIAPVYSVIDDKFAEMDSSYDMKLHRFTSEGVQNRLKWIKTL